MSINSNLRERKSNIVEKLAEDAITRVIADTYILNNSNDRTGDIISHRVHKSRVQTKYGKWINTGEDLFGLFDIMMIYEGKYYFIQVSDNLKRVLKPYRKFKENTLDTNTVVLIGRLEDYKRTVVWKMKVIGIQKEEDIDYIIRMDYSKAPNSKGSKVLQLVVEKVYI